MWPEAHKWIHVTIENEIVVHNWVWHCKGFLYIEEYGNRVTCRWCSCNSFALLKEEHDKLFFSYIEEYGNRVTCRWCSSNSKFVLLKEEHDKLLFSVLDYKKLLVLLTIVVYGAVKHLLWSIYTGTSHFVHTIERLTIFPSK